MTTFQKVFEIFNLISIHSSGEITNIFFYLNKNTQHNSTIISNVKITHHRDFSKPIKIPFQETIP